LPNGLNFSFVMSGMVSMLGGTLSVLVMAVERHFVPGTAYIVFYNGIVTGFMLALGAKTVMKNIDFDQYIFISTAGSRSFLCR
jgi:hypothetical protein